MVTFNEMQSHVSREARPPLGLDKVGRPLRLAVASAQDAPVLGQCDGEAEWAHAMYWKILV